MGLNFKLDVGLYRLDQQVACQRIDKTTIDATATIRESIVAVKDAVKSVALAAFAPRALATA